MKNKNQKFYKVLYPIIIIILLVSILLIGSGCSETKTGKVAGFHVSYGLEDVFEGEIQDMDIGDVVIVELADGTIVDALWDVNLGEIKMGQEVEITRTDNPDYWKVTKCIEPQ